MSYLIADSGATKTDWLYVEGTDTTHIKTQGLHPSNISEMEDFEEISAQLNMLNPDQIYFFGAGCGNPVSDEIVRRFLNPIFPSSKMKIKSDLEGSGRAFFGKGDGIVAVLGTGAISARIQGGNVLKKSASLGFAIGDEGSAADLGRRILKMYFRETCSDETMLFLKDKLNGVDYPEMMNRIYRAGKPNRELASIAGIVLKKPLPDELKGMIYDAFQDFINHQLSALTPKGDEEIIFTGKVAEVHKEILMPLLKEHGYTNTHVYYPVIATFRDRIKNGETLF
jgi:glucosamine kinase